MSPSSAPAAGHPVGARVTQLAGWLFVALLLFRPFVEAMAYPGAHESLVTVAFIVGILLSAALAFGSGARLARVPAVAMGVWIALAGASLFWSVDRGLSVRQWFDLAALGCVWWAGTQLGADDRWRRAGVAALTVGMFVTCAYALYQYFVIFEDVRREVFARMEQWPGLVVADRLYSNRVFATFIAPNAFGDYLALLLPGTLTVGVFRVRQARRGDPVARAILPVGAGVLCAACLVLTAARGAWLAVAAALAVLVLWRLARRFLSIRGAALAVTAAVLLGGGSVGRAQDTGGNATPPGEERTDFPRGMEEGYWAGGLPTLEQLLNMGTVRMRGTYWRGTVGMIRDYPAGGVGWGAWPAAYPRYTVPGGWPTQLAHNNYLQVLAELGPLGLGCFVTLLVTAVWSGVRHARRAPAAYDRWLWAGATGGVIAFAVHSLTDFALYSPSLAWIAFAMIGALHSPLSETPPPTPVPRKRAFAVSGALILAVVAWQPISGAVADVRAARARLQQGDPAGALPLAVRAAARVPWDGEAAGLAGRVIVQAAQQGRGPGWEAGVAALERAARQQRLSPWANESHGDALWQLGRVRRDRALLETALEAYTAATANYPVHPGLHATLGRAARALGRTELAARHEALAGELEPLYRSPTESR